MTVADAQGSWDIQLYPSQKTNPFKVTVSAGSDSVVANNVHFGDVFFCSGA